MVCGRAKVFGSALLQPAGSVCVSLSAFFIIVVFPLAVAAIVIAGLFAILCVVFIVIVIVKLKGICVDL